MTIEEQLRKNRKAIHKIAAEHGAFNIRVFGSVARGEAGPESDIDFLVDTGSEISSWFPAGLILDLQDLLGRRVEIVTSRGLFPELQEQVLQEARPL
jgi:predicted nucleotidyltransferase